MRRTRRAASAMFMGGMLAVLPAYAAGAGVNAINVGGSQTNASATPGLLGGVNAINVGGPQTNAGATPGLLGGVNAINVGGPQTNSCSGVNAINVGLLGGGGQSNGACAGSSGGLLGGTLLGGTLLGGLNLINVLGTQTNG